MIKVNHIVVAGGTGSRFNSELPKQFHLLDGRPVLMHTLEALQRAYDADVVIAMHPDFIDLWGELCNQHGFQSPTVVAGGATRWHSVSNALSHTSPDATIISVHDAARPIVDPSIMRRAIEALSAGAVGAIPAIAVSDSLRLIGEDGMSSAVDRSKYRAVQTPQVFTAEVLRSAYNQPYRKEFTDDASVVEAGGFAPIVLIEGSPRNIKITHPSDLEVASIYRKLDESPAQN